MDTKIIGQGYNIEADTSVGKELIEQFNSKRYDAFTCLVAFASYGGISALTPYIEEEKKTRSVNQGYIGSRSKRNIKGSLGGSIVMGCRLKNIPHAICKHIPSKSLFI